MARQAARGRLKALTSVKSGVVALVALAGAACTQEAAAPAETVAAAETVSSIPVPEGMPSTREIYGFIQDLTSFGPRVTGSDAGIGAAEYIAAKFRTFGLSDVMIETGDALQWSASNWSLSYADVSIPSFYMRHSSTTGEPRTFTTGPDGLTAQFIYVGEKTDLSGIDVKGKIVVADVALKQASTGDRTTSAYAVHDPKKNLDQAGIDKINPFSPNLYPFNMASAQKGGAAGFIGILSNYMDSNRFYNEELAYFVEDDLYFNIPGLWLTREDGELLKKLISEKADAGGTLRLDGAVKPVTYHTVIGYLPGQSDETLMVQSHHDSGFLGAVEDASGVAEVLALASYYGKQPLESRKRRMMFITMDTHFTEYESHIDFVEKYLKGPKKQNIVGNVTLEHIALEMKIKDGKPVMSGEVEPRAIFASPSFLELTAKHVRAHDYERTMVLDADKFTTDQWGISTDAGIFNAMGGVPVISLVTAPVYLYDIADTIDKIAVDELQPTAILFKDIIDELDEMPLAALRAGNADLSKRAE